ncbi:hypothetical protein N657DRAFT_692790 [Parathielavia appendiculata]|uniref:Uncharacterized protein n=1 Tax=Parathielavia appendiculata TaxID=2587402 RepID=A0AAN6Z0W6_9PEZI|nr:hypothetical protein N657DRAFT_692790 [Parathielavia appendiculata]
MEEIRRIAETAGSACECYINPAEIKQGSWQEDPSHCLRNCKAQFLRGVLQGWEEDLGWIEGCRSLNRSVPVREFWSLYWCDSIFCGVGIDPTGPLGQDPTVDLIINTCQNIGFHFLLDPGPPPQNFSTTAYIGASDTCHHSFSNHDDGTTKAQPGRGNSRADILTPCFHEELDANSSTINDVRKRHHRARQGSDRNMRRAGPDVDRLLCPALAPTPKATQSLFPPCTSLEARDIIARSRPSRITHPFNLSGQLGAYSLQSGAGGGGGGAIFSSSPICSPTTNKLVPRHERTLTPRRHPAYSGNPPPSLLSPSSMTLESTFSLPVPAPGSASGMWPSPTPAGDGHHHHHHHHHHQRGSASASSCYTGQTGTSTAHSSLRHEIPIAIPSIVGPGTGTANSSTNTPPPPPPLSPPPTRALPRPPPPASPPPPPASVRGGGGGGVVGGGDKAAGLAGISPTPTVLSGSLPPPALGLGRAVMGPGESSFGGGNGMGGGGKSPPPPPAPSRFGESAVSVAGQHQPDYGRPPPAYSFVSGQAASDARKERVMSRGSWGSWSAAGKVVGSGSCGAGNVNAGAGVGDLAQTEIREEGKGGGDGEERR